MLVDPSTTAMCFYCNDVGFTPILNNPKRYVENNGIICEGKAIDIIETLKELKGKGRSI